MRGECLHELQEKGGLFPHPPAPVWTLTQRGGGRRHWDRPPPSLGLEALSRNHEGTLQRVSRRRRLDMPACPNLGALGLRRIDLLGQTRSPSLTACGGSGSQSLRTAHDHLSATRPCV